MFQFLAAERHLPEVDRTFCQGSLAKADESERYLTIMNGWFWYRDELPDAFPPAECIVPVFIGFHITPEAAEYMLSDKCVTYFRRHEPIGCRDLATASLLNSRGIETYLSRCLTLTYPRRERAPADGRVFIVDANRAPIPRRIRKNAVVVTHSHAVCDYAQQRAMAEDLLKRYRTEAKLVITTRLHCAFPCLAMGIPVVFFGNPSDGRIAVLETVGIRIHWYSRKFELGFFRRLSGSIWLPSPSTPWAQVEQAKQEITEMTKQALQRAREHA